ncbi:hypothetical protein FXO38_24242 [Capsicum annuum]|uniref:Glutaredoxin domain-containing protein n=1 Tax=Capsicum annuum TaxID=4072 RepID=A0A1U8F0K2_CAPAN|nr:uncharacterized protein At5g39865 [Capsicum annuum]XP_016549684.1 uncharacterized protein At5g39865 [Capsicum annuum]KAF3636345.1 hypothetical protein FXO38_24242 [Capsicum annuum]PHT65334.1 hypothetical protein T459_29759 [Capsicum annuum]
MKAMKGKLLKKLKTIKTIGYLKPERVLHSNASEGYIHTSPRKLSSSPLTPIQVHEDYPKKNVPSSVEDQEAEIIDVSELMKDLEDQEMEMEDELDDKENVRPFVKVKKLEILRENVENLSPLKPKIVTFDENVENFSTLKPKNENFITPLLDFDVLNFRRPDLDSGTLFDPNLLAAFEEVVMVVKAHEAERKAKIKEKTFKPLEERKKDDDDEKEPPLKARKIEETIDPLLEFEEKCPPGGCDSVILYTTGLRGIRKTFEDCHSIRFLLENFRVMFFERDISMHSEFKEELWRVLEEKVVPPRLFIKGRYIGGAEEVLTLHEQGKFRPLLEGIQIDNFQCPCEGCAGMRFIMCFKCNGSQKIVLEDDEGDSMRCPECNENGLIVCPYCC